MKYFYIAHISIPRMHTALITWKDTDSSHEWVIDHNIICSTLQPLLICFGVCGRTATFNVMWIQNSHGLLAMCSKRQPEAKRTRLASAWTRLCRVRVGGYNWRCMRVSRRPWWSVHVSYCWSQYRGQKDLTWSSSLADLGRYAEIGVIRSLSGITSNCATISS
jgi:hypothetical protein